MLMQRIAELAAVIARHTQKPGMFGSAVPRLALIRGHEPTQPVPAVYEASLCLIAQGSKRVSLGEHSVIYDAAH
jgi:hypothetical protein